MQHVMLIHTSHFYRRAFGRIGSAYLKKDDLDSAIKFFQKSLTEHRTPDTLAKLKEAEKQKAEKERLAYIDPAKADAAREDGNKAFKVGFKVLFAIGQSIEAYKSNLPVRFILI